MGMRLVVAAAVLTVLGVVLIVSSGRLAPFPTQVRTPTE